MSKQEITLCEQKGTRISIYVDASLHDGSLTISGQDIGEAAEEFWGDSDYEYWLTLSPDATTKLFKILCAGSPDEDPLDVLQKKFHGTGAFSGIRAFCARHGIEAKFDSYS